MAKKELIITDLTNNEVIYIPVLPQEFKVSYSASFGSWQILKIGEVKYPEGVELSGIAWDSFFECKALKDNEYVQTEHWMDPNDIHDKLERIKIEGRPCRIMLTDTTINFDCYLESFQPTYKEIKERIYYSISWIQAKQADIKIDSSDNADTLAEGTLRYKTHVQDHGWTEWAYAGEVSGSTGQCRRIEAIEIQCKLAGAQVEYQTYLKDLGWTEWVSSGMSGTVGESRQLEAVAVRLTGEKAADYDISYRLHVRDFGWLDWSKNGGYNGTSGEVRQAEALQMTLDNTGQFFPSDQSFAFQRDGEKVLCEPRSSFEADNQEYKTYTVKDYDTLWDIAVQYYGDGEKWPQIYEVNKDVIGADPNIIHPGQEFRIP